MPGKPLPAATFFSSPEHPLAGRQKLSPREILETPVILTEKDMSYRRYLDQELAARSLELSPCLEVGDTDLICCLLENGTAISYLPDYVTEEGVSRGTLVRLHTPWLKIRLWKQLLYHRNKWVSPEFRSVVEFFHP